MKVVSPGSVMIFPIMLEKRGKEDPKLQLQGGAFSETRKMGQSKFRSGITHHLNAQFSMCLSSRWLPDSQGPVINMC